MTESNNPTDVRPRAAAGRWIRIAASCALAAVACLALAAGPASAKVIHKHLFSFEVGTTEGANFKDLAGLAVDGAASGSSRGDVYVAMGPGKLVDKYKANGEYICQITGAGSKPLVSKQECNKDPVATTGESVGISTDYGVAVGANGNVYVTSGPLGKAVNVFSEEGSWLEGPSLKEVLYPKYLALGSSGAIYTSSLTSNIEKHEGGKTTIIATYASLGKEAVAGIAVDDSSSPDAGYLYAATGKEVHVFNANGEQQAPITGPPGKPFGSATAANGVAVDPSNGDVYVTDAQTKEVYEFGPGGAPFISHLELPAATTPVAVAVSAVNGDVYVGSTSGGKATGEGIVEVFGPGVNVITLSAPSEIGETSVALHGEVNPVGGNITSCVFEYGNTVGEHSVSCEPGTPYSAATVVHATVTGLSKSSEYQYRLKVDREFESHSEVFESEVAHFATSGPPAVISEWAVAGPSTATLNAELQLYEYATTCQVQYVSEAEFKASGYAHALTAPCAPEDLGSGFATRKAIAKIGGLRVNTVYDYRFEGITKEVGTTDGATKTFVTFGIEALSNEFFAEGGGAYAQAGGHPFEMTTHIVFNATPMENAQYRRIASSGTVKDVKVQLPPGLIGNPSAVERCSQYDAERFQCSSSSEIGIMEVEQANNKNGKNAPHAEVGPVFNLVPPKGVAAEFSARFNDFVNGYIQAKVRTGEGYGVEADSLNVTSLVAIRSITVRLWGVPGAPAHDSERECAYPEPNEHLEYEPPPCGGTSTVTPFLTLPTSCSNLSTTVLADSYQAPGDFVGKVASSDTTTGCGSLHFTPSIAVTPKSSSADSPTGVTVQLHVPQNENPIGLAEANLKDAAVTMPAGVTVNPAEASGLTGCSEAQVELKGPNPAACPNSSKIGTVLLETPLFPNRHFEGGIYLAQQGNAGTAQGSNPFGSLLAIYVAIDEPETGVVVKLAGSVEPNPTTGQLTTTFDNNPQLPFEDLYLTFFGGQRSALATPMSCGSYQATAALTSWAAPGTNVEPEIEPFAIDSAAGGGACAAPGFAPTLDAGMSSNQAGGYSPFVMTLTRNDGEQLLSTVSMTMPKGLAGMLAKVPLCSQPQAEADSCPSDSQVGHVVVQVGVGSEPDTLPEAGRREDPVYLLSKTEGAPFGLAIVVHPEAGPFNLEEGGRPVIVLAKIEVNPVTAQVSVISKPMPSMLQGIPVDAKAIHIVIDRSGFMFNPTSCEPMSLAGSVGSQEGASASVSSRFQAAGCAGLGFAPKLTVATSSHVSRKDGASLHVKIAYPAGSQANLRYVKVDLPEALPSREETLKHACVEAQFNANPADCPAASVIGHAVVDTPVLPVPLTGPAYFVSYGGAKWPELVMVLQGDGVTIQLNGKTHIGKGVTSSTFPANPDVPFSTFNLYLPRGANSALSFNGSLCYRMVTSKKRVKLRRHGHVVKRHGHVVHRIKKVHKRVRRQLIMPTSLIGQNGKAIHQKTHVQVIGCGKAKARKAGHKHAKRPHKHGGHGHHGHKTHGSRHHHGRRG